MFMMEENKTPTGIKILGILHIIGGIPLIVFFGLGLYFIALGWGLLKMKPWARTLTMVTYLILLVITLFFLPESILSVIISGIILLYLNTDKVKLAFGVKLPSREDRLANKIMIKSQKAGPVGRDILYKTCKACLNLSEKAKPVFYAKLLGLADKLVVKGKTTFARKIYKHVIKGLEIRKKMDNTEINLLGKAYFALGRINIFENDKLSAFNNYKKAREFNYPLDEDAIMLLGNCYAGEGNKTKEAIEIYIEYIRFRTSQIDGESKRVYSLLESICHIDEKDDATKLKEAMSLNQRVLNANPQLEWANYYLGLGYFLKGNFNESITHLKEAQKLNPNRAATNYYLGKIYLEDSATENALSAFRESLQLDPNQADASFQVGKILIDQLEGM